MAAFDFPATPAIGQRYEANGVAYVWSGVAWMGEGGTTPLATKVRVSVYPTAGTFPYVPPADLKALQVEIHSSGGGGGAAAVTTATTLSAGGGGAGGNYGRKIYNRADLSASETLVLGAAGLGGVGAAVPTAGGTCTFKNMTVPGGLPGSNGTAGAAYANTARGGVPAVNVTGCDFAAMGGSGEYGLRVPHGLTNSVLAGMGGSGAMTQGKGFYAAIATTFAPNKQNPGCGGSGAANGFSQTATNGGDAGDAFAIFTEYLYDADEISTSGLDLEVWGDWTPTLKLNGLAAGIVYATQKGRVCKRGKKVEIWWNIIITARTAVASGVAYIDNLPYVPSVNMAGWPGSVAYYRDITTGNVAGIGAYISSSAQYIALTQIYNTGVQQTALQGSLVGPGFNCYGYCAYEVD